MTAEMMYDNEQRVAITADMIRNSYQRQGEFFGIPIVANKTKSVSGQPFRDYKTTNHDKFEIPNQPGQKNTYFVNVRSGMSNEYLESDVQSQPLSEECFDRVKRLNGYQAPNILSVAVLPMKQSIDGVLSRGNAGCHVDYINFDTKTIVIMDRNNIPLIVEPTHECPYSNHNNTLLIRTTYWLSANVNHESIIEQFRRNSNLQFLSKELQERILTRLQEQPVNGSEEIFGGHERVLKIVLEQVIPIYELQATSSRRFNSLYDHDSDLLFYYQDNCDPIIHPFSKESLYGGRILSILPHNNNHYAGVFFEINDPKSKIPEQYVCFGKTVMSVKRSRDYNRIEGIYRTIIGSDETGKPAIMIERFEFNKTEELGLYPTKEQAETNGHLIDRLKYEQEIRRIEEERKTFISKTEYELVSKEVNHLKLENTRLVEQISTRKMLRDDFFEQRTSLRKDSSELLKWLPTIITGVIGTVGSLFVAYSKIAKT